MSYRRRRPDLPISYVCQSCAEGGTASVRRVRPFSRRRLIGGLGGLALAGGFSPARAQATAPAFSYPMGEPGRALGDGFIVRHGYACVNTIVQPEWLHAAEDWYRTGDQETGGSRVYAVAAGEVVFAGYDYPGLVVIIQHAPDLFSMYGHLEYEGAVEAGQMVERGQFVGTVLTRTGGRVPSHLHFEIRDFLINPVVNGDNPSYGVHCGVNCPPGPGYWPIAAPEHPTVMGWRNPSHVINGRAYAGAVPPRAEVVAGDLAGEAVEVWTAPPTELGAERLGELAVRPGDRFPLLAIAAGPEASEETSAEGYHVWYQIMASLGEQGWVQAAVPSFNDTGNDGRPSSVVPAFLLDATAP